MDGLQELRFRSHCDAVVPSIAPFRRSPMPCVPAKEPGSTVINIIIEREPPTNPTWHSSLAESRFNTVLPAFPAKQTNVQ
jgi:hypothetical protein